MHTESIFWDLPNISCVLTKKGQRWKRCPFLVDALLFIDLKSCRFSAQLLISSLVATLSG
ncbi:MAG: hypothetical protein AB7U29_00225 [Desulfobulbus sp.]